MERNRRFISDYFLLSVALGGIVFPVLFYSGYNIFHAEIVFILFFVLIVTLTITIIYQKIEALFLSILLSLNIIIFYFPYLSPFIWILLFLSLFLLGKFKIKVLQILIFCASVSGILASSFVNTEFILANYEDGKKNISDKPSVIHIVLDEYINTDDLPKDIFTETEIRNLNDLYEERRFTRFQKSFSEFSETQKSLTKLFNPEAASIEHLFQESPSGRGYSVIHSDILGEISTERHFHAMSDYLYFDGLVGEGLENYTLAQFNTNVPSRLKDRFEIPLLQRVEHAVALSYSWLANTQKVALIQSVVNSLTVSIADLFNTLDTSSIITPLGSMLMFDDVIENKIPTLGRGQYLYAHLLLPHYPYAFDSNCDVRQLENWSSRRPRFSKQTMESRTKNYRLYYEQLLCVYRKIADLVAAIDDNHNLHDATIIIHGDHGPRIGFLSSDLNDEKIAASYDDRRGYMDFHSAFFAVRLPESQAQTIGEPIAIHQIYQELFRTDFQSLNIVDVPASEVGLVMHPEN